MLKLERGQKKKRSATLKAAMKTTNTLWMLLNSRCLFAHHSAARQTEAASIAIAAVNVNPERHTTSAYLLPQQQQQRQETGALRAI